jgi:hypothetical protein
LNGQINDINKNKDILKNSYSALEVQADNNKNKIAVYKVQ